MGALTTPSTTRRVRTIATGFAVGCLVLPLPGAAQVVTDGTVGPALALSGPDFAVTADLGEIAGANLFHSFELFSVATGESATFSGPAGLANVISRVTGGERSDIDGLLRSEVPGADFWFLNPAGVMFGPNATLDVPGSFHVSTADELRFADGAVFSATDPVTGSSFTAAAPEAFGYLGAEPAGIVVNQSVLEVLPGEALSLVGGPLEMIGGVVAGEAGQITLVALGGPGEVQVDTGEVTGDAGAAISLSELTFVVASGDGGGTVRIRGGSFVAENSAVFATNFGSADSTGGIDLHAEQACLLFGSFLTANARGSGRGGRISVDAEHVGMLGSVLSAGSVGGGDAGGISLAVDGMLEMLNTSVNPSVISSDTSSQGNAGTISVEAGQMIMASSGISSNSQPNSTGNAGQVSVTVGGLLELRGVSLISSTAFNDSEGNAGSVTVEADQLTIVGEADRPSGILSAADAGSNGNAGQVSVTVHGLLVLDGGLISSDTAGQGNAGTITVEADQLTMIGESGISSNTLPTSTGNAGQVSVIIEGALEIRDGSFIITVTASEKDAGTVTVKAGKLTIATLGAISSGTISEGNAGTVTVEADELTIESGGLITSRTVAGGNAGTVSVKAGQLLVTGEPGLLTGIFSDTSMNSTGDAGKLSVTVGGLLELRDGGAIRSSALGTGQGGTVTINAELLRLTDASITAETARADAGDILINVNQLIDAVDSEITTSAAGGQGGGGNIEIGTPQFIVLDDSDIVAKALEGDGGRITIAAGNLFRDPDSVIDASSELGLPGAVAIDAPDVDVTGGLVTLPAGFLDASSLLPESCAARGGEQGGSFVGVGRGGVAPGPETSLPAFYTSPSKTVPASADGASAAWKGDALALFSGDWGLDCDSEG